MFAEATRGKRIWEDAISLSRNIMENYITMDRTDLFYQLSLVKQALAGEITRVVPPTFLLNNRDYIIPVLCLIRLTDVTVEKCFESDLNVANGNLHRSKYVDLLPELHNHFKGQFMKELVDTYYGNQLVLCRNALYAQIGTKLYEYSTGYEKIRFMTFINTLVGSFPHETELSQMKKSDKLDSMIRFLALKLRKDEVKQGLSDRRSLINLYQNALVRDCRNFFLDPFATLMRTYETIGPENLPKIKQRYSNFLRAYDICNEIKKLPDYDLTRVLTRLYNNPKEVQALVSDHVWKTAAAINLPEDTLITQHLPNTHQLDQSQRPIAPKPAVGQGASAFRRFDGSSTAARGPSLIIPGQISGNEPTADATAASLTGTRLAVAQVDRTIDLTGEDDESD